MDVDVDPGRPQLVSRMRGFGTTIFAEMTALAQRTGAINLGQGFPDTDGPAAVLDAAVDAIRSGRNQYPPGPGVPELRRAVAEHQRRFYGLDVDPDTEGTFVEDCEVCCRPPRRRTSGSTAPARGTSRCCCACARIRSPRCAPVRSSCSSSCAW